MQQNERSLMKQRLIQFMQGRYGMDSFGRTLFGAVLVCLILSVFSRTRFFYVVGLLLMIYTYFRMFSRNHQKRYAENQRYLQLTAGLRSKIAFWKRAGVQRGTHRIYRCPGCGQKIRVPRGKGKIAITCPKCRAEFIKKT